eukprot:TRINITY_DN923_c0_g1_i5.p1 TRINITY_DN923_c0_g1~~TRINITY_DN923_c0_g1_i5.p1  ORF type:complete len:253 (-),score=55.86 TRINITY_DN923_c0_g1_i5:69-827(-)
MIPDVKLSRETIIKLNYVRLVLHMLLLWACIFSFFMLATRFGVQLYYKCFLVSAALSIMNLFLTYGKPSMDQSYLLRVSTDDANHNILCCLAFYISVPSAVHLVPIFFRSLIFTAIGLERGVLQRPEFARFKDLLSPYLSRLITNESAFNRLIAQSEVMAGFYSLFTLFFASTRNLLSTMLIWQYLRFRYMLSGYSRIEFGRIKSFLDSYLLSPRSPAPIQAIYSKACSLLHGMVQPPQQASAGAAPSCVVM